MILSVLGENLFGGLDLGPTGTEAFGEKFLALEPGSDL